MTNATSVIDQDFPDQLRKQLEFISRSCEAFDAGASDEAVRIAQSIRVLLHQTPNSTSLLKHLKATTINLTSTQEEIGLNEVQRLGLTDFRFQIGGGKPKAEFGAHLSLSHVMQFPVSKWWNQVVAVLDESTRLTRKDIVLAAANVHIGHASCYLTRFRNEAANRNPNPGTSRARCGRGSSLTFGKSCQHARVRGSFTRRRDGE